MTRHHPLDPLTLGTLSHPLFATPIRNPEAVKYWLKSRAFRRKKRHIQNKSPPAAQYKPGGIDRSFGGSVGWIGFNLGCVCRQASTCFVWPFGISFGGFRSRCRARAPTLPLPRKFVVPREGLVTLTVLLPPQACGVHVPMEAGFHGLAKIK